MTESKKMILVTGATGFVGRELIRKLTAHGHHLMLLVRGPTQFEARKKYYKLMEDLDPWTSAKCIFLWGDVTQEGVLSGGDGDFKTFAREAVKRFACKVVHCAASVIFDGNTDVYTTNVDGTANILKLMDQCEIEEIHYVSTAYVCGLRPGETVFEKFPSHAPLSFRNTYEESKAKAESLVYNWKSGKAARSATIYRPAVIVGDSYTGFTRCFHGFYALLRCAALFSQARDDNRMPEGSALRIPLKGHEPVNLVPVDFVVEFIHAVLEKPHLYDNVYHISPKIPFTSSQVIAAMAKYFDFEGIEFVGPEEMQPNNLEWRVMDYLGHYAAYFGTDSYFSTIESDKVMHWVPTNPEENLDIWIDYAVKTRFGKEKSGGCIEQEIPKNG